MDFHTFTRRELQALCKKNKIPANLTNVAMADSLGALDIVEGIEEFLNNRSEFESNMETPIAPRTSSRSSVRPLPIKDDAVNSQIQTRTRRGAKTAVGEDNENGKLDVSETPAGQSCRRRAPIVPVRPKMEAQLDIEMEVEKMEQSIQVEEKQGVPETPIATKQMRATRSMSKVQSTRRSTRLLESKMLGLSLNGNDEIESVKLDVDEKEDVPSKVETPAVSSEEVEELKEDTQEIKTQNLESSIQAMGVVPEVTEEIKEVEELKEDTQEIKTQNLESSIQAMGVVPEETEEIEDIVSVTEVNEVSGQTLNAEVEEVDEIESEISTEKPSIQAMDVQAEESEEIKDDVMKTENDEVSVHIDEAKMDEDDEIESEPTEKLQENKVEDEMITTEKMDVSIDILEDQFEKSMNLGDEKKDAVLKDYNICSLRQLKKEFKQIAANKGKKNASIEEEVVNARQALQDLSENNSLEIVKEGN